MLAALMAKSIDTNNAELQQETLTLLSCIAGVLNDKFVAFYDKFMPGLKSLLSSVKMETAKEKELRSHVIQAIGFIMDACQEQEGVAKQDAALILQDFIAFMKMEDIKDDDPQVLSVQNAIPQLAGVLKEDFKPFLQPILERLVIDARKDIDIRFEDADEDEKCVAKDKETGDTSLVFKMLGIEGQKKLQMNTSALELKINSVQIICNLIHQTEKNFH